jgi:hypothetical protein
VELYRVGQYSYTDTNDPRLALAFLSTDVNDVKRASGVTSCSFHHSYNMGIAVYATDGLKLERNVMADITGPAELMQIFFIFKKMQCKTQWVGGGTETRPSGWVVK